MKKIILFVTILALSGSMYGQAQTTGELCGCDGPETVKTYVVPTLGSFEITIITCGNRILVKDMKYTGIAAPFVMQSGVQCLLGDPSLAFTSLIFAVECARMSTVGGGGTWGEGSGPRGTVSLRMEYCSLLPECCEMNRQYASGAFVGMPQGCDDVNANTDECFKICHPAP